VTVTFHVEDVHGRISFTPTELVPVLAPTIIVDAMVPALVQALASTVPPPDPRAVIAALIPTSEQAYVTPSTYTTLFNFAVLVAADLNVVPTFTPSFV
jgi:hypothetical protein